MKICPICDHVLNTVNYCPVCKHVVKKPWILGDNVYLNHSHSQPDNFCEMHDHDRSIIYLNRSHPAHEKVCSYHNPEYTSSFMTGGVNASRSNASLAGRSPVLKEPGAFRTAMCNILSALKH